MALSASYDYNITGTQLIAASHRLIGISTATTTQKTNALEALEMLLKSLSSEGFNLVFPWSQEWITQALVVSTASYTLDQKVITIDQAFIRDSDGNDTPVIPISAEEYFALGTKDTESRPSQFWADKQLAGIKLYLYPVPDDATDVLHLLVVNKLQDMDVEGNNIDINSAWFMALKYLLAAEIAPEEGILVMEVERLYLMGLRLRGEAESSSGDLASVFITQGRR